MTRTSTFHSVLTKPSHDMLKKNKGKHVWYENRDDKRMLKIMKELSN